MNLTLREIDAVVAEAPRALVELWAGWSGPSFLVSGLVDDLIESLDDPDLLIGRIDVDRSPGALARYHVATVPALLFFRNGDLVDRIEGLTTAERLGAALARLRAPRSSHGSMETK